MPRSRARRFEHALPVNTADVVIPDKLYFRIGEVSRLTQTKAYVLRFWETEFPTLRPVKSDSGHRLYRRKDVEMVFKIRELLYDRGFTIDGARKRLADGEKAPAEPAAAIPGTVDLAELKAIRRELQSVLTTLSRKC